MRILLFVSQLWNQTGGEINTRDWALGLKARGHRVAVYTPAPGPLAATVRNAGIAVVDDPARVDTAPDVMFGSGVNEMATLSARFPDVAAVQLSQQWDSWASFPSLLPQVVLYVAVDEINEELIVNEFGVPRDRVRVVHNAVDLGRIPPRPRLLPPRPERALMFVKANDPYVTAVRAACDARRIALDCIGPGAGRVLDDPLAAIVDHDLVIGSARTAIEGAAAGAAVLVADHRGLAELLTTANFERLRTHNFGREVLTRPLDFATIGAELDRYDPADAAAASALVRESASLDRQLDRLESLLSEAVALFRQSPPPAEQGRKALASYLGRHLPRFDEPAPRHARFRAGLSTADGLAEVARRLATLEQELADLREARAMRAEPLPSQHLNLLRHAETLDEVLPPSAIATLERVPELSCGRSTYRIAAAGDEGEHYLALAVPAPDEELIFSLDVRAEGTARLRVQLLDGAHNGAFVDVDLAGWRPVPARTGTARNIGAGAVASGDGWHRVWVGATMPPGHRDASVIVQLADPQARLSFVPQGESVLVRGLQLSCGRFATPHPPVPRPGAPAAAGA